MAVCEADEVVGAVFEDDAFENIENFEAQMVVLDPRGDIRIAVKLERFTGFPAGIEDAEIDVGAGGGLAGATGEPSLHVAGGADRAFFVEYGNNGQRVFKADGFPEVLNNLGHVEGVEDAGDGLRPG